MDDVVNLTRVFEQIETPWVPRIIGALNGQFVKAARFEGAYVRHHHEREDELFWVVRGRLEIELPDRTVEIGPGEFFVVPHGVEHRPVARKPVECVLFEPATTRNTGNVDHPLTIEAEDLDRP